MLSHNDASKRELASGFRDEIESCIANDDVDRAFKALQDFVSDLTPKLRDELLLLLNRYRSFKSNFRIGTSKPEDITPILASALKLTSEAYDLCMTQFEGSSVKPSKKTTQSGHSLTNKDEFLQETDNGGHVHQRSPLVDSPNSTALSHSPSPLGAAHDKRESSEDLGSLRLNYWSSFRATRPPEETTACSCNNISRTYKKGGNTLRNIGWLQLGILASKAVCRIVTATSYGTGFLVKGGIVLTNNHVLSSSVDAKSARVEFNYEEDIQGQLQKVAAYRIDAATFVTSKELDTSAFRLVQNEHDISNWGMLTIDRDSQVELGAHVSIIQHPNGGVKQISVTDNQIVNLYDHRLHYMTDTLPGSSGAPVFNDKWNVIAIHRVGEA